MRRDSGKAIAASLIILLMPISCAGESPRATATDFDPSRNLRFSRYTDPGGLAFLFDGLPESFEELVFLIKRQLIHPYDIGKFAGRIPRDRIYEDRGIPTVADMLEELLERDDRGLILSREPKNRLVVACVHHSLLLASILRHRGIPVRIRTGFATYIGDNRNIRVSHAVCEVWDRDQREWILIDPDRERVNFPHRDFEFAFEAWARLKAERMKKKYYVSRYDTVDQAVVHLLCHDLSYVIGHEEPYWIDPPIVMKIRTGISDLSRAEIRSLDEIAGLLRDPDQHPEKLESIQAETEWLRYPLRSLSR